MHTPAPDSTPTTAERLEAMEYFLGQALLAIEADSAAMRAQLNRLEAVLQRLVPQAIETPTEEEDNDAFTLDGLAQWMQTCLKHMRTHQSVTARQMVAIGQLADRVVALGATLTEASPPPIGPDAQAALDQAKRRPPTA